MAQQCNDCDNIIILGNRGNGKCSKCHGLCTKNTIVNDISGSDTKCWKCKGTGACSTCGGSGRVASAATGGPAPKTARVEPTPVLTSDLEREWYRLCNSSDFIPESTAHLDHARIAEQIVQRTLLRVESRHDVANHQNNPAHDFREVAAHRAAQRYRASIGTNDLQIQRHLARRRAKAADEEAFVSGANSDADQILGPQSHQRQIHASAPQHRREPQLHDYPGHKENNAAEQHGYESYPEARISEGCRGGASLAHLLRIGNLAV